MQHYKGTTNEASRGFGSNGIKYAVINFYPPVVPLVIGVFMFDPSSHLGISTGLHQI